MDSKETRSRNIVLLDDEPEKANRLASQIAELNLPHFKIHAPKGEQIEKELGALFGRRHEYDAREKNISSLPLLDSADILIVDFDLRDLRDQYGFATGEEIAYSARLFSTAKVIVVLNHPDVGTNHFDLTLQRDRELRADLYIGFEQCRNPALWIADPTYAGFLPWSWTPLIADIETFDTCVERVLKSLDKPVLEYFGLTGDTSSPSSEMLGYLGIKRGTDVTFGELFSGEDASYVRKKDIDALKEDRTRYSRVAAAFLRKWFRRWVVPPQNLIADIPHFVASRPWSLVDPTNRKSWDEIALRTRAEAGADELRQFISEPFLQYAFTEMEWIGRPAIVAAKITPADGAIEKLASDFDPAAIPRMVFAEDVSRFVRAETSLEYSVTLDGEQQIRCIADRDKLDDVLDPKKLGDVVYSPESLLL